MKTFVKGRLSRILAKVVMVAFVFPLLGSSLGAVAAYAQPPEASVIVFTLENKSTVGEQELADRVTNALKMALEDSGRASVVSVDLSSPTVQRAINVEKTLTEDDFALPMDRDRAARIARALGVDFAFLGTIESYRFDEDAGQVSIALSVQKVDAASGEATAIGVVGKSDERKEYNGKEGPLMTAAIDDAVYRVVEAAFGPAKPGPAKPEVPMEGQKKKKKNTWVWILLALGALALATGGGGGEEKAPQRVASPVTSAVGQPTASAVQLSWEVASSATVGGFKIYRAAVSASAPAPMRAGLAGRKRVRQAVGDFVEVANVAGSDRGYSDSAVTPGHLYMYEIRARTGGRESNPRTFVNFYNTDSTQIGPGVPQPPTGVTASAGIGVLAILVQWNPNAEPFVGAYRVYRSTSATGIFTQIAEVVASVNEYNDATGLTAGSTYYYTVAAVGAVEAVSQPASFTAQSGQVAPPTNLQGFPEPDQVRLTWVAPSDPAVVGYNIYRDNVQIAQVTGAATTTYTDTTVVAGETYSYMVRSRAADQSESVDSNVVVVGPSAPADNIDLSAQPGTITANGTATSTLSAVVTAVGDPVGGASVTFETDQGTLVLGGQAHGDTLVMTTNTAGIAQCQLRAVQSATQVVATVTASTPRAGGGVYSDQTTVTMQPPTPSTIEVSVAAPNLPGNGESSTTVTATVRDQSGGGVPSVNVTFSILPELGTFNPVTVQTNVNGQAQTTLTSSGGWGSATITATTDGIQGTGAITFTPPPEVGMVVVTVTPNLLPAGGVDQGVITIAVTQVGGEPVPDGTMVRVGFEPDSATVSPVGARVLTGEESLLTTGGVATSHLIPPDNLELGDADIVIAWTETVEDGVWTLGSNESKGSAQVRYSEPAASITMSSDPPAIAADGNSTTRIRAEVFTAIPNTLPDTGFRHVADGTPVTFATSLGSFLASGGPEVTVTTLNGTASVFLRAGSAPGTALVTATTWRASRTIEVAFNPAGPTIEILADPASLTANGTDSSSLSAIVRSADGVAADGVEVAWSADLGSVSPAVSTTSASGIATATLTAGIRSGTCSVVARADSLGAIGTRLVPFVSGQPARIQLLLEAPGILSATGGLPSANGTPTTTHVDVQVTDQFGNPVTEDTPVQFHTDIGMMIPASVGTDDGAARSQFTAPGPTSATNDATLRPGWATITARVEAHEVTLISDPVYVVCAIWPDVVTHDGSPNATEAFVNVPGGADYRSNPVGGGPSDPGNPVAGEPLEVVSAWYDASNNPQPEGTPVQYVIRAGSQTVLTQTVNTGPDFAARLVFTPAGITEPTLFEIEITCSSAYVGGEYTITLYQWVSPAGP